MLRRLFPLVLALLPLCAAEAQARPLKVVATFSIVGEMVAEIAGPAAEVTTIVGPDSDTHAYEPRPAHVRAVAEADLVVANGLGLEPWLDRLVASAGRKPDVVIASQGIPPLMAEADEEGHGHAHGHHAEATDPHAWQDLANGRRYVATIAGALVARDPDQAAQIEANAAAYDRRLTELDAWVKGEFAAVPADKRRVVTSHDAFAYFGRAYGIELLAAQGLSTEAEPTAKGIARLARQMRDEKVKVVFLENMASPRLIQAIGKDAGAVAGGTLYADALSPPDGPAPTYEAMFRHNVRLLKEAMLRN